VRPHRMEAAQALTSTCSSDTNFLRCYVWPNGVRPWGEDRCRMQAERRSALRRLPFGEAKSNHFSNSRRQFFQGACLGVTTR